MIICSCNQITVDQFLSKRKELLLSQTEATPQQIIDSLGHAYVCGACVQLQLAVCKKQQRGLYRLKK